MAVQPELRSGLHVLEKNKRRNIIRRFFVENRGGSLDGIHLFPPGQTFYGRTVPLPVISLKTLGFRWGHPRRMQRTFLNMVSIVILSYFILPWFPIDHYLSVTVLYGSMIVALRWHRNV